MLTLGQRNASAALTGSMQGGMCYFLRICHTRETCEIWSKSLRKTLAGACVVGSSSKAPACCAVLRVWLHKVC